MARGMLSSEPFEAQGVNPAALAGERHSGTSETIGGRRTSETSAFSPFPTCPVAQSAPCPLPLNPHPVCSAHTARGEICLCEQRPKRNVDLHLGFRMFQLLDTPPARACRIMTQTHSSASSRPFQDEPPSAPRPAALASQSAGAACPGVPALDPGMGESCLQAARGEELSC